MEEFFHDYVDGHRAATVAFLPGNCAQAYISLAICQELLTQNPRLHVVLVPKSCAVGNDLQLPDAQMALAAEAMGMLAALDGFSKEGRFVLVAEGPTTHVLDPARLPRGTAEALAEATVVLAEGQAYAEIRGWKRPTYIAFRVNGRVAEAIHGVSRKSGPCAFVRLTAGLDHFQGFEVAVLRSIADRSAGETIPAALQTTSEYVSAILAPVYELSGRMWAEVQ